MKINSPQLVQEKSDRQELEIKIEMSLNEMLGRLVLTYGLKQPSDPVCDIIIEFIKKKFGFLTIEEIEEAFMKVALGELYDGKSKIQMTTYGEGLNVAFIAKVLSSYRQARRHKKASIAKEVEPMKALPPQDVKDMMDDDLRGIRQEIEKGNIPTVGVHHFNHIEKHYYQFTREEVIEAYEFCKYRVRATIQHEKNKSMKAALKNMQEGAVIAESKVKLAREWLTKTDLDESITNQYQPNPSIS